MSDFKANILHQIVCHQLCELTALPRPPRWILGAYFEGEGRDERGRKGRPEKGRKGKGKGKDRVGVREGRGQGRPPS